MNIDFLSVLIVVLSLILLAVPGFLLVKGKLLSESASGALSNLVLYGCQPVLVFMSFQEYYSSEIALNILIVAGLGFLVHFIMFGLMALIFPNKKDEKRIRVVKYGSCFANCGFMGLPFLQMLFEKTPYQGEIIIYAATIVAVFNILNWTVGVFMMTKDKNEVSTKKILFNPVIIAVILGVIYFFVVKKPITDLVESGTSLHKALSKIMGSIDTIGDMVTPLSMTVIGMRLAKINIKQLFADKWAYVVCAFKLVVMSFITMLIVAFLPVSISIKYVLFFLLSMPSATSTALFAVKFGGDGDSASVYVLLTTTLCILTIPLMYLMFSGVFGIVA